MATWNGHDFIRPQLQSILEQSRLPDLLVIGDDRSTDGTQEAAEDVLAGAGFSWHLSVNDQRLGAVENFGSLLAGPLDCDIVVLSDQDDVWSPNRLQRIADALAGTDADGVFHNGQLIDAAGTPQPGDLWSSVGFRGRYRRMFDRSPLQLLLNRNVVTGAAFALRRDAVARALPIGEHAWHDHWLALVTAATGRILALDEHLLSYRVHSRNAAGLHPRGVRDAIRARRSNGTARLEDVVRFTALSEKVTALAAPDPLVHLVIARKKEAVRRYQLPSSLPRRCANIIATLPTGE